MSRYKKILDINERQWIVNSPVCLDKGALLNDNVKEENLLQLQFRNIKNKNIIAMKISIVTKDITHNEVDIITYEYLDINIPMNGIFGSNIPVYLPNTNSRNFDFIVDKVVYVDNTVVYINSKLISLPPLSKFNIMEYQQLYQDNVYGKNSSIKAMYEPYNDNEFWYCTCGALNVYESNKCINCHKSKLLVFDLYSIQRLEEIMIEEKYIQACRDTDNIEELKQNISNLEELLSYKDSNELINQQKIKLVELQARNKAKLKKKKKKMFIGALLLSSPFIIVSMIFFMKERERINDINYNKAIELMAIPQKPNSYKEEWQEAYEIFSKLGNYRDADELAEICKNLIWKRKYSIAVRYMKEEEYKEALKLLKGLGGYKDSKELIKECKEKMD